MVTKVARIAALAALSLVLFAPSAHAGPRFYFSVGVPAPIAPVVAVRPPVRYGPPGFVWRPAYTAWNGYGYVVVPGAWVRPPHPRAVWVAPRWNAGPRGTFWVNGYWRRW
jgi:hypothetical protein